MSEQRLSLHCFSPPSPARSHSVFLPLFVPLYLYNSGGGATGTVCFHCQGNQLSLSCANTPNRRHAHTNTRTHPPNRKTIPVWQKVGYQVRLTSFLFHLGQTWASAGSSVGSIKTWCWWGNDNLTLFINFIFILWNRMTGWFQGAEVWLQQVSWQSNLDSTGKLGCDQNVVYILPKSWLCQESQHYYTVSFNWGPIIQFLKLHVVKTDYWLARNRLNRLFQKICYI